MIDITQQCGEAILIGVRLQCLQTEAEMSARFGLSVCSVRNWVCQRVEIIQRLKLHRGLNEPRRFLHRQLHMTNQQIIWS